MICVCHVVIRQRWLLSRESIVFISRIVIICIIVLLLRRLVVNVVWRIVVVVIDRLIALSEEPSVACTTWLLLNVLRTELSARPISGVGHD